MEAAEKTTVSELLAHVIVRLQEGPVLLVLARGVYEALSDLLYARGIPHRVVDERGDTVEVEVFTPEQKVKVAGGVLECSYWLMDPFNLKALLVSSSLVGDGRIGSTGELVSYIEALTVEGEPYLVILSGELAPFRGYMLIRGGFVGGFGVRGSSVLLGVDLLRTAMLLAPHIHITLHVDRVEVVEGCEGSRPPRERVPHGEV